MMRRNLEGKLNGDGIKMGQAVETGVTVLAPLVVGKVFTPVKSPQSLKTLGGLPEAVTVPKTTVVKPLSELFDNRVPKASEVKNWAESQGWKLRQNPNGPPKYVDENNVVRITIDIFPK